VGNEALDGRLLSLEGRWKRREPPVRSATYVPTASDDGDVGVVEGSGCAGFLFEASEPLRVTGVLLLCPELDTARLVRRSASPERTLDYDGASRPTNTESYVPRVMF